MNSCPVEPTYPLPWSSIYTFLSWLLLISEFPLSLTDSICESVDVDQSLGSGMNSVASNFIISLGATVNKYFQIYPSSLSPAAEDGSNPVNKG